MLQFKAWFSVKAVTLLKIVDDTIIEVLIENITSMVVDVKLLSYKGYINK